MITFLLGRLGTAKNEHIVNSIARDAYENRPAFWLVPEQKAVLCERKIATSLDPSAQLRTEVLNFTRLADKVFRKVGGLKYDYITNSGKSLIMYRALCEVGKELTQYDIRAGRERGYVQLFLDAVGELKSYCVGHELLTQRAQELESEHLRSKIGDLVRVFERYEQILTAQYSDPYDDLTMLAEKLRDPQFFGGSNVYISSFDGFTGAQMGVLRQILTHAENVCIALDIDRASLGKIQYAKLTATLRSLERLVEELGKDAEIKELKDNTYHENDALAYLSDNIWSFGAKPYKGEARGITLMRPSDEFDECEVVAGKIRELVMNGARYGEIAVIMRNADTYGSIIDFCFDKYDIPYYMSVSTDISTKPLIRFIYSAIGASSDFNIRDIISFIRSGYAGVSNEDADELESYIYRWGIYGKRFENDDFWSANPDGYETEQTPLQMERLGKINDTRSRVIELLLPLRTLLLCGASAPELCKALYELMVRLDVRGELKKEIAEAEKNGDSREAKEISQLYRATMKALSEVAGIMSSEPIDKDGFISALSYALSEVKIGTIPTGEDNVTIGEAGALRTESIKYAFVLGVCEGSFPQTVKGGSFFSDNDKDALKRVKIDLSASTRVRADNELLNFKNSIAIASRELVVSAPRADIKGAKREPSIAYERIKALFPSLAQSDEIPPMLADKIYTTKIAREYSAGDSDEARIIREVLGFPDTGADFSNEALSISPECASSLLKGGLYLSQSKIEKFVTCRFAYYCKYMLGLKDSEKITFGSREVGVLSHSVLEHFLKQMREGKEDKPLGDEEIKAGVDALAEDYIRLLYPQGEPTSKLKHLFARLKSNLLVYIKELDGERAQSKFTPELFEIKFDKENGVEPLSFELDGGKKITLTGTADRVDAWELDDKLYLRVVDYKSGRKSFSFDEFNKGTQLQLFIYLFTLCGVSDPALKEKLFGKARAGLELEPAGVMYYPMSLGRGSVEANETVGADKEQEAVMSLAKRRGVFLDDETVLRAQDSELKGKYLPQKGRNKQYYRTREEFDALRDELEAILKRIGSEMLSGDALAKPLTEGEHSECKWCVNRSVCRRRRR